MDNYYYQITICRSCGEIVKKEKVKSEFRKKPVYKVEDFCKECKEAGAK